MQRILIIEDNPADVRLIREALRDERSIELVHASLLEEGLERIEDGGIELVLLDLSLPDSHPQHTVAAVRAADPALPIIVMSGADDEAVKGHSVATGAQDYFVKGGTDGALLSRAIAHAVERQRLLNELESTRREALRQKDLFLSQVAHELRTPLTALSHFVTLVADGLAGELNPEQQEYLSIAGRNAKQLAALISDLTDTGRLKAEKLTLAQEMLDVGDLCRDAAESMRPSAQEKGIDLVVSVEPTLPRVYADPLRTKQILVNLLDNAIRHGPERAPVAVAAAMDDGDARFVTVTVIDRGHFLTPEAATRIFDQLVQEPGSTASRKGLGLGLYIAREIVDRHGGTIWVDTSRSDATAFRFTLPTSPYGALPASVCERYRASPGGVNVVIVDFPGTEAAPSEGSLQAEHILARSIIDACIIQTRDIVVPVTSADPRSIVIILPLADEAGTQVVAARIEGELRASPELRQLSVRARVGIIKTAPLPTGGLREGGPSAAVAARLLEDAITSYLKQSIDEGAGAR